MRFLFVLSAFLASCTSSNVNRSQESIIVKDLQKLSSHAIVQKTLTTNGKTENLTDTIHDWKQEFYLFIKYIPSVNQLESDYNNNKISESYTSKTVYTPKSPKHELKELEITQNVEGIVVQYQAHINSTIGLNYANYNLYWNIENKEYRIEAIEGIAHSREIRYSLVVRY